MPKKKSSKKKSTKKVASKSPRRKPSQEARVRTGILVPVSTLTSAKVEAAKRGCNVGEVLGDWASRGRA